MSSYRQNALSETISCPECGKNAMKRRKGGTRLEDGFTVNNIERWVCGNCGNELFDPAAMELIRTERARKTRAVAA
jgi:YgiT-type zinc finger domain-containing protein